jgi:hypothetical protein
MTPGRECSDRAVAADGIYFVDGSYEDLRELRETQKRSAAKELGSQSCSNVIESPKPPAHFYLET